MPDPHVLYAVTAVVVLGLIAWVVAVLARPDASRAGPPGSPASPPEGDADGGPP
jgi:hypothetical protein